MRFKPLIAPVLALALLALPYSVMAKESKPTATITLATTTSVQDTGLLEKLLPVFRAKTGIDVKVVAVGSGQAMELGMRGDADILLVHSPKAEEKFMAEGPGLKRHPLMHNDFVILGITDDPAKIKGSKDAADAFTKIAQGQLLFVSRGDNSGTHSKEKSLWEKAKITPAGIWYLSAGAGMGEALRIASEKRAYILSDRATYLSQKKDLRLDIVVEGDPALLNNYSVIELDPKKLPKIKSEPAAKFREFMFGPDAAKVIKAFGVELFGQPLFILDK